MGVKVSILCDDVAGQGHFMAEQGLSILVEVDGQMFLWDTGQFMATTYNAQRLGIDLKKIVGIGISHGHYDHCGGLPDVLGVTGPKRVVLHPEALSPKYHITAEGRKYVGVPFRTEWIRSECENLEMYTSEVEVMPDVVMTGEIPRATKFEEPDPDYFCLRDEALISDPFIDDQALVVRVQGGLAVITGCAHAGLLNTLVHVVNKYGPIKVLIGGTHLSKIDPSSEKIQSTLDYLESLSLKLMVFCHCTGLQIMAKMADRFPDNFKPGYAGFTIEL